MFNENFIESPSRSTNVMRNCVNPRTSDSTEQITSANRFQRADREHMTTVSEHGKIHRAIRFRGKSNRLSKLRCERDLKRSAYKSEELPPFTASRTDCHYKIKSRAAPDLHWQAFKREDHVPLPPGWKTEYPQYNYEAAASPRHRNSYTGASSRPPRTSVFITEE